MINDRLEEDLKRYANNHSRRLFTEKLYLPLTNIFKWLCAKQYSYISNADYKDIEQLAMLRVINNIKYYKPDKGMKALSFVRMLISQELHYQKRLTDTNNNRSIEYNHNIDNRTDLPDTIKAMEEYKKILKEYRTIAPIEHRTIITCIANTLTNQNIIRMKQYDRVNYYSLQTNKTQNMVESVIIGIKKYMKDQ